MNRFILIALLFFSVPGLKTSGENRKLPSVILKSIEGKDFNTSAVENGGKPVIILFWATWCRPCIKELTAISEVYDEWKEKTGVKIYAIAIDDSRTQFNIRPMVTSRGWAFEFYNDMNGEFKRAMGVNDIPHLFILNGKGEIVYQQTSYTEGSEEYIFERLQEL
jgi:cytochrome c biogenesis protein CcmG, thiol:disulfide interchange protein DsbE